MTTVTGQEIADLQRNHLALRQELSHALAWVRHWQDDVAAGLKPTTTSLADREAALVKVLMETR